jgi:hypothetical protein
MSAFVTGAIIGGIGGLIGVVIVFTTKEQRYKKLLKTITGPIDYSGLYHYASFKRFRNSVKFFDSYGILYLIGKTVYYKTKPDETPLSFDLGVCSVQQEPDWRFLKWFSITTPAGEKFYFDSNKMGILKNNSDETLKGLAAIKAKMGS